MLINIIFLYNNFVEEDCGKTFYVTILVIFFFLAQNSPKYCTQSSFYERNVIIMKSAVFEIISSLEFFLFTRPCHDFFPLLFALFL